MNTTGRALLILGAGLNFLIAVLHLVVILVGAPAYLYFGAADLSRMAEAGSPVPALLTLALTAAFIALALYGLSGAGVMRRLPLLTLGLALIGVVYTLRGLIVILDLARLMRGADYPFRQTVFSTVALAVGLAYLLGTFRQRRYLRIKH